MSCFPCFKSKKSDSEKDQDVPVATTKDAISPPPHVHIDKQTSSAAGKNNAEGTENENGAARTFNFRELAAATKNFRQECLMGEGGFGRVFKGTLKPSGQIVVVRQLDRSGTLASKEFLVEVMMLSLLRHPNLVNMIGYCADGDQRILVYEYLPSGSLENHLFANEKPLDWSTRMKIASGIASGLEYLHEKANPPIIYRDLKSSNILLDEMNHPRLSEYGLAKLVQSGNKMHISPRVMAVYGYCAPEYERQGELTLKSDVYSFGVVLLELLTGRRALDSARPTEEQNLVSWAQPFFRDPKKFPDLADPLLKGAFPATSLNQAVGVAAMCLQEEPSVRPLMADVVAALSFLAISPPEAPIPARLEPLLSGRVSTSLSQRKQNDPDEQNEDEDEEDYESSEYDYSSEEADDDDDKRNNNLKVKSEKRALSKKGKGKVEFQGIRCISGTSGTRQENNDENYSSQQISDDRRVTSKNSRSNKKKDVNSKSLDSR